MHAVRACCGSISMGNRVGSIGCVRRMLSLFSLSCCGARFLRHFRVTCMTRDRRNSRLGFCMRGINSKKGARGRTSIGRPRGVRRFYVGVAGVDRGDSVRMRIMEDGIGFVGG